MSEPTIRTEADAVIEQTLLGVPPVELRPGHVYAVSEAVLANGGTGTITLKITVAQLGHENRLVVKDQVDVKTPKPLRESSIWFYNKGQRGLSRRDPKQGELELAVVPMRPRVGPATATDRTDKTA